MLCVWGIPGIKDKIHIEDEKTPLQNTVAKMLCEQEEDKVIIPDKYNTGASGELTKVTEDCYISGVKFGTTGSTDRKLDLYYQSNEVPDTILVENYDFSASDFKEYNVDKVEKSVTIIYRNCKFQSYTISGDGLVNRQFENCSFTHFAGSDSSFVNCYFGGGMDGDGINPMENCTFTNCLIADLIQPAEVAGDKHVDGFQIFGSMDGTNNTNIRLDNCRFEVPYIPMSSPSGALNCPLSIIMRYSDADNIIFNDCYINGGLYYGVMILAYEQAVTNLTINNMHIGGSSKSLYTCDSAFESLISQNVSATDSLYVASVRKLNDGIHLSVTNDTLEARTLSVLTASGVTEFQIPACYKGTDLQTDTVTFDDYPFDMDIVVPDAEWVACFDSTYDAKQIRFVNWSDETVYADLNAIFPPTESVKDEIVISSSVNASLSDSVSADKFLSDTVETAVKLEGTCGDNISYSLDNGILTLSGTGNTYDYHSGNTAPWYDVKDSIVEVIVGDGITRLGNQLFAECNNISNVKMSEGLTDIGSNVFKKCNSIQYIFIPRTLISVGKRSFTSNVTNVEYGGDQETWNAISFGEYNDGIINSNIICETVVDSGMCGDNVEWSFTSNGRLILAGEGETYDYHSANQPPWYGYVSEVKEIVIKEGITVIGNYSFRDCKNVVSVVLPKTITEVGINSFSRCNGLSEITVFSSLTNMGKNAFAATNISKVYFYGNEETWNAITDNPLLSAEVIYK